MEGEQIGKRNKSVQERKAKYNAANLEMVMLSEKRRSLKNIEKRKEDPDFDKQKKEQAAKRTAEYRKRKSELLLLTQFSFGPGQGLPVIEPTGQHQPTVSGPNQEPISNQGYGLQLQVTHITTPACPHSCQSWPLHITVIM